MPFVPVPEAIEVRMEYTIGDAEQMVNVFHYHNLTPIQMTAIRAENLGLAVETAWEVNLMPIQSDQVTLQRITVKDISEADQPAYPYPVGISGGLADQILPYPVSLVGTLYTEVANRSGRGRIFLGGFTEVSNIGGDQCSDDLFNAATSFLDALSPFSDLGGEAGADYNLGVVSRYAHVGGDPGGAPVAPVIRDVVHEFVNRRWDNQRRRSNKIRI